MQKAEADTEDKTKTQKARTDYRPWTRDRYKTLTSIKCLVQRNNTSAVHV